MNIPHPFPQIAVFPVYRRLVSILEGLTVASIRPVDGYGTPDEESSRQGATPIVPEDLSSFNPPGRDLAGRATENRGYL